MKTNKDISLQNIYKFLSLSMKYPEPSWFNEGYMSNCLAIMYEAGLRENAKELEKFLKESGNFLEDIQVEYTRLFINAVPLTIAPPFGAVYLDRERSLYGSSTEKVKDFYRKQNFELIDSSAIPDEISIELDFLALLISANKFVEEDEFLSKYFRPWFIQFKDLVIRESQHPFYKGIIRLIDFFTSKEED